MTEEPLTWDDEYLDHVEELLDALADGYGINSPGPEDAESYREMLNDLRESRP